MFQGQYHAHPYGGQSACYSTYYSALTSFTEINCSIQVPNTGPNPQLEGLEEFWVGVSGPHQCLTLRRLIHARRYRSQKGWTCPGPGSHHFPRVRGGGVIALFFLPAGRIACERHRTLSSIGVSDFKDAHRQCEAWYAAAERSRCSIGDDG